MGNIKQIRRVTWACDVCGAAGELTGQAADPGKVPTLGSVWTGGDAAVTAAPLVLCEVCRKCAPKAGTVAAAKRALRDLLAREPA
jgi:hypothetical protein